MTTSAVLGCELPCQSDAHRSIEFHISVKKGCLLVFGVSNKGFGLARGRANRGNVVN